MLYLTDELQIFNIDTLSVKDFGENLPSNFWLRFKLSLNLSIGIDETSPDHHNEWRIPRVIVLSPTLFRKERTRSEMATYTVVHQPGYTGAPPQYEVHYGAPVHNTQPMINPGCGRRVFSCGDIVFSIRAIIVFWLFVSFLVGMLHFQFSISHCNRMPQCLACIHLLCLYC